MNYIDKTIELAVELNNIEGGDLFRDMVVRRDHIYYDKYNTNYLLIIDPSADIYLYLNGMVVLIPYKE